jgi:hypothetical protein
MQQAVHERAKLRVRARRAVAPPTPKDDVMAELGPVELLFVEFPGNQFTGEIIPALSKLIDGGTIRVLDLVFVAKDADGNAVGIELEELPSESKDAFSTLVEELESLISEEDVEDLAEALEPNSSAAIMLFEHTWTIPFRDAITDSGGRLVARLPITEEALAEIAAAG